MFKIKVLLVFAFIVCSTNSIAYATGIYPFATNELGLQYEATDIARSESKDAEEVIYTVVKGDNLYRIALAHDVSLEALIVMNNLTSDLIYPGDELKIVDGELNDSTLAKEREEAVATINAAPVPKREPKVEVATSAPSAGGKEMIVTATAYTAYCAGCSGTTAYGIDLRANPNQKVIAVDPRVIPLGTKVWVEGYGEAIAGDTGGAIKGNKIDVFMPQHENAMAWGVKTVKIRVLN
ncbi:MAG: 3D domain-containing protein [Lysinibacillus sp.]